MRRFLATTIGCKVNQYDTEAAAGYLESLGLRRIQPDSPPADGPPELVVINTCCVTAAAAAKGRRAIRRAVRRHPDARVLILGCAATNEPESLRRLALEAGAAGVHVAG
ncbi:MAG: hypothetical protein B1H04_05405, partial [Planctomycetales bacterium 4484_123]